MAHSHDHSGGLGGAAIRGGRDRNRRRLVCVLGLVLGYAIVELVGGLWTGSLALLADSLHMVSDVAALGLSTLAVWMASRPATQRRTFGHSRAEILAALANGLGLGVVAVFIGFHAIERFLTPREIAGLGVLGVATGGLIVNLVSLAVLESGRGESLNVRGAWLHVLSDTLASVGVIFSGLGIWLWGWLWLDPVVSVGVSLLVLRSAWILVREALDVLMEAVPPHLDPGEIRGDLLDVPGVTALHCLHIWMIGSGEVSLSSHLVIEPGSDPESLLQAVRELLETRFAIEHTTIQLEVASAAADGELACGEPCEVAEAFG